MSLVEKKYGKSFCVSPWTHAYFKPTGEINLCCMNNESMGVLKNENLLEAWNTPRFRESRREFLRGKAPKGCSACFDLEDAGVQSQRLSMNSQFGEKAIDFIEQTSTDGGVDELNLKYLDLRWSNLCNFKCRFCSVEYSSSWFDDLAKLDPENAPSKKIVQLDIPWEKIRDEVLPHTDSIGFAGGEPLLMADTYRILEHLAKVGRTSTKLNFVTNLSVLEHKGAKLFHLLMPFNNVSFSVSIDGTGRQFEYMRKGGNWKQTRGNLFQLKDFLRQRGNNDHMQIHLSIYFLNVLRAMEIVDELQYQFNLPVKINISTAPAFSRIDNLPQEIKNIVLERYKSYRCTTADTLRKFLLARQPKAEECWGHLKEMFEFTANLDKIRKEDFFEVFPEWYHVLRRSEFSNRFSGSSPASYFEGLKL